MINKKIKYDNVIKEYETILFTCYRMRLHYEYSAILEAIEIRKIRDKLEKITKDYKKYDENINKIMKRYKV